LKPQKINGLSGFTGKSQ